MQEMFTHRKKAAGRSATGNSPGGDPSRSRIAEGRGHGKIGDGARYKLRVLLPSVQERRFSRCHLLQAIEASGFGGVGRSSQSRYGRAQRDISHLLARLREV